jgi:hypothetical protein
MLNFYVQEGNRRADEDDREDWEETKEEATVWVEGPCLQD